MPTAAYVRDTVPQILQHQIIISHHNNLEVDNNFFEISRSVIFLTICKQQNYFKKCIWHGMCFDFIQNFLKPRRIQWEIINLCRPSCKVPVFSCQILTKHEFSWQILVKISCIKFHEYLSHGGRVLPYGETSPTSWTHLTTMEPESVNSLLISNEKICSYWLTYTLTIKKE